MNEKTTDILDFASIATAETLIGKLREDWDIEDGMVALEFARMKNREKAEHLKKSMDTYFGIAWNDFLEVVKAYGFKRGYSKKFTGTGLLNQNVEEEEIIFYHEEKGLILYAESFNGRFVNSAKVYGEVVIIDNLERNQWEALQGCSHVGNENGTISFSIDVREGFRFHLDALLEAFDFSTYWTKVPFLWFLNYRDTKEKNYNFKKINKQKIRQSSPEVRKIIFGK